MLYVEGRLPYEETLSLLALDAPEIRPIKDPTPEQLEQLESIINTAEGIFSPWPEDFNGRAAIGCFLYSQEEQPEDGTLRDALAACVGLEIPLFAVIGMSTELLAMPSDGLHTLICLHEFCHLLEPLHNDDFELLFGRQLLAFFAIQSRDESTQK